VVRTAAPSHVGLRRPSAGPGPHGQRGLEMSPSAGARAAAEPRPTPTAAMQEAAAAAVAAARAEGAGQRRERLADESGSASPRAASGPARGLRRAGDATGSSSGGESTGVVWTEAGSGDPEALAAALRESHVRGWQATPHVCMCVCACVDLDGTRQPTCVHGLACVLALHHWPCMPRQASARSPPDHRKNRRRQDEIRAKLGVLLGDYSRLGVGPPRRASAQARPARARGCIA
jgi:hypothetical protein